MTTAPHRLAVGTYTEHLAHVAGHGLGIHLITIGPDGVPHALDHEASLANPSYLCANPAGTRLYAVSERALGAELGVYALDPDERAPRLLRRLPLAGADPCHISLHAGARRLCVSHYGSGELLCLHVDDDGMPAGPVWQYQARGSGPDRSRQEAAHLHCAIPAGDGIVACDLGADRVTYHALDGDGAPRRAYAVTPGAGPRHAVTSGARLYVINELDNTLAVHDLAATGAQALATVAALRAHTAADTDAAHAARTPLAAALRLHPNGRWLYASVRGADQIVLWQLDERGLPGAPRSYAAGGRTPRDIALTPDGRFLLAALQDDDRIVVHAVGPEGDLREGASLALASPACLCALPA
ncbi:lactonase family protein [Pseudomonadota bacterium AL_CKDN230030165-1A_HGKHYDSX7]